MSGKKSESRRKSNYTNKQIEQAVEAVKNGTSLREASRNFNIPRTTLTDIINGKSPMIRQPKGPPPVLGTEGEKKIYDWIMESAACGFPVKKYRLLLTVQKIVSDSKIDAPFGDDGLPGRSWFEGFMRRHPDLSEKVSEGISKGRSVVTEECIRKWFRELHSYLKDINCEDILNHPSRIMNGDETAFQLCPDTGKVIGPKAWKNIYEINVGNDKETITVLLFITASGKVMTPMIVYPYTRLPKDVADSVPSDFMVGKSDTGWMTSEVFYEYMANSFNKWLEENKIQKPVLCLSDGHKSHLNMALSEFCSKNGIILYSLPPNCTHILQPADVSVFKPLKQSWKSTVTAWQMRDENCNQILNKVKFAPLLKETLASTDLSKSIRNGFRACGLYPFNVNAIDFTKCVQNKRESLANEINRSALQMTYDDTEDLKENLASLLPLLDRVKNELAVHKIDAEIVKQVLKDKLLGVNITSIIRELHKTFYLL